MPSENIQTTGNPEVPKDFDLLEAIELIPQIVGQSSDRSYFDRLRILDPVVRVFTLARFCEPEQSCPDYVLAMAIPFAQHSAHLRQMLIQRLLNDCRFDLMEKIVALEKAQAPHSLQLPQRLMVAQYKNDYLAQIDLHEKLFLQTGNLRHIAEATMLSGEWTPWQNAWKHALRKIFTSTAELDRPLITALDMLRHADARVEFATLADQIALIKAPTLAKVYGAAQLLFWKKDYHACLDLLKTTRALAATEGHWPVLLNLAAKCAEAIDDFQQAAVWYKKQNKTQTNERKYIPAHFIRRIDKFSALAVTQMSPDKHSNYFVMTGFPRSGTTLLENALNAHPLIATCEETSSLSSSIRTAYHSDIDQDPEHKNFNLRAAFHRRLYYQNIDRFITKPAATVVIDKTPIISSNIKYMEKIFPTKRYIFSIRHPYDVVLSNLKQVYGQNLAMAAFNDIHDACVLYDKVMSDWFEVFPGETDRVYYVRYDELVTDFRRVIEGALVFLGVDWTDEVMKFAEHSSKRAVRTPSYTNVRKGLTIGVQSSWKNFEFLFDKKCKALLDPWRIRFGYSD